jgi:hypothetical protein
MTTPKRLPAWTRDLSPAPTWATDLRRSDGGWEVEARWWGNQPGEGTQGPREVVIRLLPDAPPEARHKGVNTGVMRRMEQLVAEINRHVEDLIDNPGVGAYDRMARGYVRDKLATLPDGPREGGDAYYAGLLALFEDVAAKGHPEPLTLIASVMGAPKDTVKTRLRVARQRRDQPS